MLDPDIDYSELEAKARKRWPDLVGRDGRGTATLREQLAVKEESAAHDWFNMVRKVVPPSGADRDILNADPLGANAAGFDALGGGAPAPEKACATFQVEQDRITREVIIRSSAPVFRIRQGGIDWDNALVGQAFWRSRLDAVEAKLKPSYGAIGRIEAILGPFGPEPLGTAWLIAPEVIVTNAHVARYFGQASDRGWRYRMQQGFDDRPMSAMLDTSENANGGSIAFDIVEILSISAQHDRDVAFLRIDSGVEATPIRPFEGVLGDQTDVAIIGYPERDETVDVRDLQRFFGDVWGWKRFAPGMLGQIGGSAIRHLCNTLGGNSGSPLLDLSSGQLIGLHYGGIPDRQNPVNYALPAHIVFTMLKDLEAARPLRAEGSMTASNELTGPLLTGGPLTVQIPLTVTVSLSLGGQATSIILDPFAAQAGAGALAQKEPREANLETAAAKARQAFIPRDDVLHVRTGWKVSGGVLTDIPAIVVAVRDKEGIDTLTAAGRIALPTSFGGYPIDVKAASIDDLLEDESELVAEAARRVAYRKRPDLMPKELSGEIPVAIAPGPDAGSGMLLDFLGETSNQLTVGMYEFTAPHIRDGVIEALADGQQFQLVLQKGESIGSGAKRNDITDAQMVDELSDNLGEKFTNQWSATAIHPYYHIKVAAQDDRALWLSSGSWQSSNQPLARTRGTHIAHNREMHVHVSNAEIATLFRRHVEEDAIDAAAVLDREAAGRLEQLFWVPESEAAFVGEAPARPRFFEPLEVKNRKVRILPLLTPDNYSENLLDLIRGAKKSILFHNQSFGIAQTRADSFEALLAALKDKQLDPQIDVKIILRGNEGLIDARGNLEKMKSYGFLVDPEHVRIQPRLHNKMWVFDGLHTVIGSHNFTNQGTTINRDASLLFRDDKPIADYATRLFDHDWERLADRKLAERTMGARRARRGEAPPPGMRVVSGAELMS